MVSSALRPAALLALALLAAAPVRADGSRDLTNSGGARPYLEAGAFADNTTGIARDHRIYVWAQPGETILVASSAFAVGAGDVELTRPDGSVARLRQTPACWDASASGTARALRGRIADVAQEVAGPRGSTNSQAGGYDACEFAVPAGQGGVWRVHFTAPQATAGNPTPRSARAAWTQPTTTHTVSAWDVTVRGGAGANVPGRVWARFLPINMGNYAVQSGQPAGMSSTLYAVTRDGYRWTVDHNGMVPFGAIIIANRRGILDSATRQKQYTSVSRDDLTGPSPAFTFKRPDEFDTAAETMHKLFFLPPAADLPETAPVWFQGATRTDWVLNPNPRIGGSVVDYRFVGADGVEGQVDPDRGGTFEFLTDSEGAYTIRIDRDDDGTFETDLLAGLADEGANAVAWDGTDADGDPVASGLYAFEVGLVPRRGEIHFPYFDAEQNLDGIKVTRTNGPGAPDRVVYWDDTRIGGTANAVTGADSQNGAHRWGDPNTNNPGNDFGNEVGIDTWAYVDYAEVFDETTVRAAETDLGVDVRRLTDPVGSGGAVTYELVVANNGPDAAPLGRLTDAFPPALTGVTWACAVTTDAPGETQNRCDAAAGTASASGTGDVDQAVALNPGAVLTFTVQATHDGSGGAVTNEARVRAGDAGDPVPANDVDADTFTPAGTADLSVTVAASDPTPPGGSTQTYTVTLANDGPDDAAGIVVGGELSGDFAGSGAAPSRGTYDPATGWRLDLAAGQSATLVVTGTAGSGPSQLTAEVLASDAVDPDSTPNNGDPAEDDQATATMAAAVADLSVTVVADPAGPTAPGGAGRFTVTLANDGPSDATNVETAVTLAGDYTATSVTPSAGTYDAGTGVWSLPALAAGETATLTVEGTVGVEPSTLTAEVTAADQDDADSTPANEVAAEDDQDAATIRPARADLRVATTVDEAAPGVGDDVTFTVVVTNDGPDAAGGVALDGVLAGDLDYVSAASADGAYDPATGVFTLAAPLAPGASATVVVTATVTGKAAGSLTGRVRTAEAVDPDSTPGNDDEAEDDQDTATVTPSLPDLAVAVAVSDAAPPLGADVTFTVTLSNTGGAGATGVDLAALLPAGYTFVSATPERGAYDPVSGVWTPGAVAAGETLALALVATAATDAPRTFAAEVTRQDQPDADSAPGDGAGDDAASVGVDATPPDLALAVSVGTTTPTVGQDVAFTVTLDNEAAANATGIDVAAALPDGYAFVSAAPDQGTHDAGSGTWTVGALAGGAGAALTVVGRPTRTGTATFTAQVAAMNQPDADSTPGNDDASEDDQDSVSLTATAVDLAVALAVDDPTPPLGADVTFTVTLANEGGAGATGVGLAALLPAGYTFVSATPSQGTYDASTGRWTAGAVGAGGAATLAVVATVADRAPAPLVAQVAAQDQPDADSAPGNGDASEDDQASAGVSPRFVDLAVDASASTATPVAGEDVTFAVDLVNEGTDGATGVALAAPLPAGYAFVSATPSQGAYAAGTGGWTAGALASGGVARLQIVGRPQDAGDATFTAQVSTADQPDADSTPGNDDPNEDDQDSTTLTAQAVDLELALAVDDAAPDVGESVAFTVDLANVGAAGATGVAVSARLPAGYALVSATPSQGTYDAASGTWTVRAVGAGGAATLQIAARAETTAPSTLTAQVSAADQVDADSAPGNNDASEDDQASVTVSARPVDLRLAASVSDAAPPLGTDVAFEAEVTNDGPADATGVAVSAPLPPGYAFVSADPGVSYDPATGVWTVGAVPAGQTATLRLVATATTTDAVAFAPEVTAADQPDADSAPGDGEGDDAATVAVAATPPDLAVSISSSNPAPAVGDEVTLTVVVRNQAEAGATGVDLATALPPGLSFVSATPSRGTYDPATGAWTVGAVEGNTPVALQIVARLTSPDPQTVTAEVASQDQPDADSTPGNNDPAEDDQASLTLSPSYVDLALQIETSDAAPPVGSDVTLTVTLDNDAAATSDASGVAVAVPLPAGLQFRSVTAGQGSYDPGTGRWSVGGLAIGGRTTLQIVARVTDAAPPPVVAQVSEASPRDLDSTPGNDDASEDDQDAVSLVGQTVDLELAVSASTTTPTPGEPVTLTVSLDNVGGADAPGTTVAALVPPGYTLQSASPSQGTYDAASGTWTVGTVVATGGAVLQLVVVPSAAGTADFQAEVTASDRPDADSTPNNNDPSEDDQDRLTLAAQGVDLALAASVDDASPVPGQTVTFAFVLDNEGGAEATGVDVAARLPAGLTFVSATPARGTYDPATGAWAVGAVPGGGRTVLTVRAVVDTADPATVTAQVTAADQPDPDSTPNNGDAAEDDQASVTVTPSAIDLALDMAVDRPAPDAGEVVTFTVTLANEGTVGATGVQVSNPIVERPGFELVSVTPSRGTYAGGIWTVGGLAVGGAETLAIRVRLVEDNVAFTNLAEIARADQPDGDSTPNNGATAEDDYASATATTGGSSSGGEGGLESNGSLAQAIGSVLFQRRARTAALLDAGEALPRPAPLAAVQARLQGARSQRAGLVTVLPTTGPEGSAAVAVSPTDLLPVTNAREVVAADYLRPDGRRVGVVFATTTAPGEVYEHTKPVCDRLRGATLDAVELLDVAGRPFVLTRLVQADGSVDYAVSFVAYGPEAARTVDSRFLLGDYNRAATAEGADVVTVQVWSPSRDYTAALVRSVLDGMAGTAALRYRNAWPERGGASLVPRPTAATPALPALFVRRAEYRAGRVEIEVHNAAGLREVEVTGGTLARTEGGGRTTFARTLALPAGSAERPTVSVAFDTGSIFDVAFFVGAGGGAEPDQLYLADGTWGVATDDASGATRLATFEVRPETGAAAEGQLLVERPVRATGTVATWATVYRTLRSGGQPLDVSGHRYLEFTARGSGEVTLLVQKAGIQSADQYGAPVRLTAEPQRHRVWFDDLLRADGSAGFTGDDVQALSFTARGDGQTAAPFEIAVSDLAFGGAEGDDTALPEAARLAPPAPNPFADQTRLRFELPHAQPVRLTVYDVLGRQVVRLVDGEREAGRHTVRFDGRGLASGVYVVRLALGDRTITRQMTLVR